MKLLDASRFINNTHALGISLFTIQNQKGIVAQLTNYGARIVSLFTPDREAVSKDIVLGYDKLDDYLKTNEVYLGATIGRMANRIANAEIALGNKKYKLSLNEGNNHLHGGFRGLHDRTWRIIHHEKNSIEFSYFSKHLEEGYPGNLELRVKYSLSDQNALTISYWGKSDQDTVLNLTHHSYFNLKGENSGDILDHKLKIDASNYLEKKEDGVPTGKLIPCQSDEMDFTQFKAIGTEKADYDHCYVLNNPSKELQLAAEVFEQTSGRTLKLYTTAPGLQLYISDSLQSTLAGKSGRKYGPYDAFCLEPQHFPDSPNHSNFPSTLLKAGDVYQSISIFEFGTKK